MKKCSCCKEILPLEAFSKSRSTKDGLQYQCKECKRVSDTTSRQNKPLNNSWAKVKSRAKRKGIPYEEDDQKMIEHLEEIFTGFCPLLGIPIRFGNGGGEANAPDLASLDRIRPNEGYTIGNVQYISNRANTMKSNASPEELLTFWKNFVRHHAIELELEAVKKSMEVEQIHQLLRMANSL